MNPLPLLIKFNIIAGIPRLHAGERDATPPQDPGEDHARRFSAVHRNYTRLPHHELMPSSDRPNDKRPPGRKRKPATSKTRSTEKARAGAQVRKARQIDRFDEAVWSNKAWKSIDFHGARKRLVSVLRGQGFDAEDVDLLTFNMLDWYDEILQYLKFLCEPSKIPPAVIRVILSRLCNHGVNHLCTAAFVYNQTPALLLLDDAEQKRIARKCRHARRR
jgi:hypothetical protein